MELDKLTVSQIKSYDESRRLELKKDLRQELLKLKMDIYAEKGKHSSTLRKLRKNLARVLTVNNVAHKA